MSPSHSIRCAVIGYGSAAQTLHLPLVSLEPRLRIHGIVARKPAAREQAAARWKCGTYAGIDEMLADREVDLVVIATPHDSHAAIAIAALDAGKHVVTDKPMCLNLAEFEAMRDAQRRSGKLLTVFHNARLSGDFVTLWSIRPSLGDLRWLEINWNRHGLSRRSAWRNTAGEAGGRLIDLGVHLIDQALLLFPERVTTVHTRVQRDWPDADVESACMITIGFESGRTAVIDVGSMSRIPKPKYHAVGTLGAWSKPANLTDPQETALAAGGYDAYHENPATAGILVTDAGTRVTPTLPGDWRRFYAGVADALRGEAEPPVRLAEMRRVIAVLEAAIESARTGHVVVPV